MLEHRLARFVCCYQATRYLRECQVLYQYKVNVSGRTTARHTAQDLRYAVLEIVC